MLPGPTTDNLPCEHLPCSSTPDSMQFSRLACPGKVDTSCAAPGARLPTSPGMLPAEAAPTAAAAPATLPPAAAAAPAATAAAAPAAATTASGLLPEGKLRQSASGSLDSFLAWPWEPKPRDIGGGIRCPKPRGRPYPSDLPFDVSRDMPSESAGHGLSIASLSHSSSSHCDSCASGSRSHRHSHSPVPSNVRSHVPPQGHLPRPCDLPSVLPHDVPCRPVTAPTDMCWAVPLIVSSRKASKGVHACASGARLLWRGASAGRHEDPGPWDLDPVGGQSTAGEQPTREQGGSGPRQLPD